MLLIIDTMMLDIIEYMMNKKSLYKLEYNKIIEKDISIFF